MVYRPDGSGRDMYVLGPKNSKGPQIVDVAARTTSMLNREANRALLNASLARTDNKVPPHIPTYEMKALITRKISDRSRSAAEAATLSPAKLTLNAAALNGTLGDTLSTTSSPMQTARTALELSSSTMCPSRYNSGVAGGGNSPTSAIVLERARHFGAANSFFTSSQRSPSSYVSPKTPSNLNSASGRVGGSAFGQALETAATVASLNNTLSNSTNNTNYSDSPSRGGNIMASLPSSPRAKSEGPASRAGGGRRTPNEGFVYSRHIYESTQERANRTGRTFQPYEAPLPRSVLPEIRVRYSNMQ